ncbi:Serine/threonine-protein phosphatase bsl2 [Sarracenia purpurea var. burkii]
MRFKAGSVESLHHHMFGYDVVVVKGSKIWNLSNGEEYELVADDFLFTSATYVASGEPLASAYGLAKHRDGRWEWAIAPGVSPSPRYQHAAVFVNARLHVSGGALGGGRMVEDSSSVAVLDTAAGVWCDTKSVVTSPRTGRYSADAAGGDAAVELTRRCRHAAAAVGDLIFIYGGLRGGKTET